MSNEDKTNKINSFANSEIFNISKHIQDTINNPIQNIINNSVFKTSNKLNETLKPLREVFKISETINKMNKSFRDFTENYEKDKEAVKGNIYVGLLLDELDSLEYQKEYLKKQLDENQKVLKKLRNDIDKAITPETSLNKQKKSKKKFLYKIDFENSKQYIQIIFNDINNLLFENSNLYQWECLLNCDTLPEPIKLREKTNIKDLRYFLDGLVKAEIIKKTYLTLIENIKAFIYNDKYITAGQLSDANQDLKEAESRIKTEINNIFKQIE